MRSSSLSQRGNGAVKATNVPSCFRTTLPFFLYPVDSSTKPKQGQSKKKLLPNQPTLDNGTIGQRDDVAFSSNRTSHVAPQKSTAKKSSKDRRKDRKASNESGYGRSRKESSLNTQRSLGPEHLSSKHTANTGSGSTYRSTTHSDYKDPKEDRKQHLYSSEKENLSNCYVVVQFCPWCKFYFPLFKTHYHTLSYIATPPKQRKIKFAPRTKLHHNSYTTKTALPADLKCSRKSSLSTRLSNNSSPSPTGRGNSDGPVGLRNLGNTCFMNSILQCLRHTPSLTKHLLRGFHTKNIKGNSSMKGELFQEFAELIKSMCKPRNNDAVSPHTFKTQIEKFAPRFVGYNQQDAQEFLHFLLEGLHDDLNRVRSKPKYTLCEFDNKFSDKENAEKSWKNYLSRDNSLITDLFVGQLKSMLTCCKCDHRSVRFEPFWELSLPIPQKSSGTDDGDIDIRDCMLSFTKEEILDGDERPTCNECKMKRKSTKKFSIQRFPPILVLHLKRFCGSSFGSKLQSNVNFPMTLDLAEFSADSQECRSAAYSLYAVSNHLEETNKGHYTAYCKHPVNKKWHCFNDSKVHSLPSSRVRGPQAYILFYEKMRAKSSF